MGRRDEGYGDLLAGEIRRLVDAGAVTDDQLFGIADQGGDQHRLDRQAAAGGSRQRARADIADLDVAGGDGGDHLGARIELAPVDLPGAGLLVEAIGLRDLGRLDHGLVGDRHLVGRQGRQGQGKGCGTQRKGCKAARKGKAVAFGHRPLFLVVWPKARPCIGTGPGFSGNYSRWQSRRAWSGRATTRTEVRHAVSPAGRSRGMNRGA